MKKTINRINLILIGFVCLLSNSTIGQNWNKITSSTAKKLNTIAFASPHVGYIGGNDSLLLKTLNGGATWSKVNFSGVTFYPNGEDILNLQFINDSIGFMTVGPYSGSYETKNGGLTWTRLALPSNQCFNKGIYFFDELNGFIGGSACFIGEFISYKSSSVWSTGLWTPALMNASTTSANNYITDIDFYSSSFGLAVSKSGYIYRTTDGGLSWDSIASSSLMEPLTSVVILSDSLAYAGYDANNISFGLLKSIDGGLSWNYDNASATFFYPDFMALHKTSSTQIFTSGVSQNGQGLVFNSVYPFTNWPFDVVAHAINDIASYQDSVVFIVGDSGYVAVNKPIATLGIDSKNKENEFALFPSPAKTVVNIKLKANTSGIPKEVVIYSSLGVEVLREKYTSSIDITALNSGVYVFEIRGANFSFRQKLIKE